jgi:hypothetical protein
MYEHLQAEHFDRIGKVIAAEQNPHHRAILENYQLHVALEQGGRWAEILVDDMIVDEPHYEFRFYGQSTVCNGRAEVDALYTANFPFVAVLVDERLWVSDEGIASRSVHYTFGTGERFNAVGADLDPAKHYLEKSPVGMFWWYTSDVRLIGEEVWQLSAPEYVEMEAADVPGKETVINDCAEFLASVGR